MKNIGLVLLSVLTFSNVLYSQTDEEKAITTALSFLTIAPDARSGGMGDVGVSTTADANSFFHNPAKYAFQDSQYSFGINYVPWMRSITNDMFVGGFNFSNRFNERSAWATSFRYFSLGEIQLRDDVGNLIGVEQMNELAIDLVYSLKLSERFSMGIDLNYFRSDLAVNVENSDLEVVNSFSVGVSGYYRSKEKNYGDFNGVWHGGFNISNIGPKVQYSPGGDENFLPTNLKLGGGFDFILDSYNRINVTLEMNKLLVPTPPITDNDGNIVEGKDDNVDFFQGMIQSFNDAPGGFSEELKEIIWGFGAEYVYNDAFMFRAGYHHEDESKGARQYLTVGAGFGFKSTKLDISYLFNTASVTNPLENTLRFSLRFDLGTLYGGY